jgi:hypothetical protein
VAASWVATRVKINRASGPSPFDGRQIAAGRQLANVSVIELAREAGVTAKDDRPGRQAQECSHRGHWKLSVLARRVGGA